MEAPTSSDRASQRGSPPRSAPRRGTSSRFGADDLAGVMSAYLQVFSRPPLGDHPEMDGFVAGRVLAAEYPDEMQRLMSGIRQGLKRGSEAADRPRGQSHE